MHDSRQLSRAGTAVTIAEIPIQGSTVRGQTADPRHAAGRAFAVSCAGVAWARDHFSSFCVASISIERNRPRRR